MPRIAKNAPACRAARRRLSLAGAFFGACIVSAGAAVDPSIGAEPSAAGRWKLSLGETNRQCRLVLRSDATAKAYRMGMPAGCRRAMPILSAVGGWMQDRGGVQFTDDAGQPVLRFSSTRDASTLLATGPEGETYDLVAMDGGHVDAPVVAQAAPAAKPPSAAGAAEAPGVSDIPGRYAIFRKGGKDTGCMLTLDGKARGPKGGKKATLAPACADSGIVIFNPVGWRLEDGRLTLTAKKGHETHLDYQTDGTWHKDPKEGAFLGLKKM